MRKAFFKGTVMEGGTPSEARVFIPGITRIIRWAIIFSAKASSGAINEATSTRLIDIDWKNAHLNLEKIQQSRAADVKSAALVYGPGFGPRLYARHTKIRNESPQYTEDTEV